METTWDGLPIADDHPRGASVVARRPDGTVLLLHRAHHGPDFAGDWAWTPPAGSRQPGEPIYASVLRELAEEADLTGLAPVPVDLSTGWGLLTVVVRPGAPVTLVDPEHDQFAWVSPDEAYARCRPTVVADGVRRAVATPVYDIAFAPMTRDDYPAMLSWLHAAHVAGFWHRIPDDPAGVEAKYGPRIDGTIPVRMDIVRVGGRPVGFMQSYPLAYNAAYMAVAAGATAGGADAVGIDYAIGDPSLTSGGLGTQMIWAYLRDVVVDRWPATRFVVADPDPSNVASGRALLKAGFLGLGTFDNEDGPHRLHVFNRARVFGGAPVG